MDNIQWACVTVTACLFAFLFGALYGGNIVRAIARNEITEADLPISEQAKLIGGIEGRPREWVEEEMRKLPEEGGRMTWEDVEDSNDHHR